jgi:hypothetical protein
MILKKDLRDHTGSSAHILGLKVTGGVMDRTTGRLGAVVEKVKVSFRLGSYILMCNYLIQLKFVQK